MEFLYIRQFICTMLLYLDRMNMYFIESFVILISPITSTMPLKEVKARIKIDRFLREAGWRLEDSREGKANVVFESLVKITQKAHNELG